MIETQTDIPTSAPSFEIEVKKLIQDLDTAKNTIQSFIDRREKITPDSISSIPSILKQAQEILLKGDERLQQSEAKLKDAQKIAKSAAEMQTLLNVLPVGIMVSQDPQNLNMEINPAGLRMLNLPSGSNPSKSAPGGDQLPFKVFRGAQEVSPEELPMQYASNHQVELKDIELEVMHRDGKILNLLEYATPLYDEQGAVRGSLGVFVDITARKSIEKRLIMHYTIARVLAESSNINSAASQVLQLICETASWEYGALWRVEADALSLTNEGVWHSDDAGLFEYAETNRYSILNCDNTSLPGYVFQSKQAIRLSHLEKFELVDTTKAQKAGIKSGYILPVRSGERVIAILECLSIHNQIQDQNLTAMLNAVCNQMGIFLERKMFEEALAIQANQQHLLAQAGIAFSSSLDYEKRLQTIMHVIVPDLADWCAIDIIDQNNILRRAAAAHINPGKEALVYQNQPTRQIDPHAAVNPQFQPLQSGQSLLFSDLPSSLIERLITDPNQLEIIRQLKPISTIIVPLIAHDRILGLCTFVQSDSGRHYVSSDLPLAEGIARLAALSLDNALLYSESQKLNSELEFRVDERTAQLKIVIDQLKNQISERQNVEEQVRILNSELEQRIAERTSQLEVINRELHQEISDHQQASQSLQILLNRTRELYRISRGIGIVRTPKEVLSLLLSSSYLKDASRASIAILDGPWIKGKTPPRHCDILAEWNRGTRQPHFIGQRLTLEEYGVALPVPYARPIIIQDIQSTNKLPEIARKRFADLQTYSLIILPLIAGGEWYGLLSLHFETRRMTNNDDLLHVRGLVDETAIVIKNMRLLETESQARQEAEKANDLKLKFLGMISHELRTPLTSIKGFATTLLADDVVWSAEKERDFLETINRESDKLHDLIEQLLDLSRMEAGVLRILQEKMSIHRMFDSAIAQLQAVTPEHELILEIPAELPEIFGDEMRIAQVLTNLVSNAARYSPPGTQIILSAHRSGGMVQIDVADHGPGIPPQDRVRVFEAFRQLENDTGVRTKGAGLGLAICKGLIEAHNGKIWIQNLTGPGTVVSFTLPICRDSNHRPE